LEDLVSVPVSPHLPVAKSKWGNQGVSSIKPDNIGSEMDSGLHAFEAFISPNEKAGM
jgi:hypothetical protein